MVLTEGNLYMFGYMYRLTMQYVLEREEQDRMLGKVEVEQHSYFRSWCAGKRVSTWSMIMMVKNRNRCWETTELCGSEKLLSIKILTVRKTMRILYLWNNFPFVKHTVLDFVQL